MPYADPKKQRAYQKHRYETKVKGTAKELDRHQQYRDENRDEIRKKHREYMREYRKRRGARYALACRVWRDYGLRLEEYDALLAQPCGICGGKSTGIDHCHREGHIRAPLCNGCNAGLGFFNEDPGRLRAAADYLERGPRIPTQATLLDEGLATGIADKEKRRWYFTFGVGQPNAGRYFVVDDATFDEARARMLAVFGREWAFQYDDAQWHRDGVSQAERYGLEELA